MQPTKTNTTQHDLFRSRLSNQLNPKHPLYVLSHQIRWEVLEKAFSHHFTSWCGQPPKPVRLMTGLMMLQHMHGLSDEVVVQQWVENPYFQYFCGFDYLQWEFPADASSLTRWRQRLGTEGMEMILAETVQVALATETVAQKDLERVIVDTTVMEKNITFPTDARLLHRARAKLVRAAHAQGITLRQTYVRKGKQALHQAGR